MDKKRETSRPFPHEQMRLTTKNTNDTKETQEQQDLRFGTNLMTDRIDRRVQLPIGQHDLDRVADFRLFDGPKQTGVGSR